MNYKLLREIWRVRPPDIMPMLLICVLMSTLVIVTLLMAIVR